MCVHIELEKLALHTSSLSQFACKTLGLHLSLTNWRNGALEDCTLLLINTVGITLFHQAQTTLNVTMQPNLSDTSAIKDNTA